MVCDVMYFTLSKTLKELSGGVLDFKDERLGLVSVNRSENVE